MKSPFPATRNRPLHRRRPAPKRRFYALGLGVQVLEERVMFAHDLEPDAITVGRTLSTYSAADVRDNEVTITYTVYNQRPEEVAGVLLTDTLAPGVNFKDASQAPDRDGQELAWSIGTLPAHGRASVELTVSLANAAQLQLDDGAEAFGVLLGGAVGDDAPPAVLRASALPEDLLASTPDANATDHYIQSKAAELDYDPQRIFDYLHHDVGYESYVGSLRGARGALWSSAGNALDVASLGVALMRASGMPAEYVSGALSHSQAQALIQSMFPANHQTGGHLPVGTEISDPANDPKLLAETTDHYWFRFDSGGGMQDADPLMAGAQIGQTFTAATADFAEVPDGLRHKTRVTLTAEIFSQIGALFGFGDGRSTTVVVDETFNDVDLVGRPISIGHFVNTTVVPSPIFTSRTTTYAPYLVVGDYDSDPTQTVLIHGQSYQEVATNFPLASQALTGLFLEIELSGPDGPTETHERALVDRIGFAARQGGQGGSVSFDPDGPPALTDVDIVTIYAMANDMAPSFPGLLPQRLHDLGQRFLQLPGDADASGDHRAAITQLLRANAILQTRLNGASVLSVSDRSTADLESGYLVKAYFDRPRLTLVSTRVTFDAEGMPTLTLSVDLRRNSIRAIASPGQAKAVEQVFQTLRGIAESVVEMQTPLSFQPEDAQSVVAVSTAAVFLAATEQGVEILNLTSEDLARLNALEFSPEALARMALALEQGKEVVVPARPVLLNGAPTVAWYEIDPLTGEAIGVTEDGGHQQLIQAAFLPMAAFVAIEVLIGFFCGFGSRNFGACEAHIHIEAAIVLVRFTELVVNIIVAIVQAIVNLLLCTVALSLVNNAFHTGFACGNYLPHKDPPLPEFLVRPVAPRVNKATLRRSVPATVDAGGILGEGLATSLYSLDHLAVEWSSNATTGFQARSLSAGQATVRNASGAVVGTGAVALAAPTGVPVAISGPATYDLQGQGSVSFFGAAGIDLGAGGEWIDYSATVAGDLSIALSTASLTLNGQPLPAGEYTIAAAAAVLAGSGPTAAPNFASAALVNATDAVVYLGSNRGNFTLNGDPVDLSRGAALTDYAGSVTVGAGGGNDPNEDRVTLDGQAGHVLTVSPTPATFTTDQNTPITLAANVQTSLAGEYDLMVEAPPGWLVAIDDEGLVTVTPASGLQSGAFPIAVIAQSVAEPQLVSRTTVDVTIASTQPGLTFDVRPDANFTVPFDGAQVPSAFRADLHNTGPVADTFHLTFDSLPSGFEVVTSTTSVAVPPGETGVLGIYLRPTGADLPAPGTQVSFTVTATSGSNPAIAATETEVFTVPEIHAVGLAATDELSTLPGGAAQSTLIVSSRGNVAETVTLAAAVPPGITLTGLPATVNLAVGETREIPLSLTVAPGTPLNSRLTTTITAEFGGIDPQAAAISVTVAAPGVLSISQAAAAVTQLNDPELAGRLNELSTALNNLMQAPDDQVFKTQAVASLDAIQRQIAANEALKGFEFDLALARDTLAAAATPAEVLAAVDSLGFQLESFGEAVTNLSRHSFLAGLQPNTHIAQPNTPARFDLFLQNTGSRTTTYNFDVPDLIAGVTATFSSPSVTLAPGEAIGVAGAAQNVSLSITSANDELMAFGFTVLVTPEEAPQLFRGVPASLTLRDEVVRVVDVQTNPPFTDPGGRVNVLARLLNTVNRQQQVQASFTVRDQSGNVVFTSTPTAVTLTIQDSLVAAALGSFDTTGLEGGDYSIEVAVSDAQGQSIPEAVGRGHLMIGLPVTAQISVSPDLLPPGNATVTNTLTVAGRNTTEFINPLTLRGQVDTPAIGETVALLGNLAYVCGTEDVGIVDVTDPAHPQFVKAFAEANVTNGGFNVCQIDGGRLYVASQNTLNATIFDVFVFSLTDPVNPQLLSSTPINSSFISDFFVRGDKALAPTNGITFFFGGSIFDQFGDVVSLDLSNPAAPTRADVLFNNRGGNQGSDTNQHGGAIIDDQFAYIASTTSTGGDTHGGVGRVLVVDWADPANLSLARELQIPGTNRILDIAVDGDRALVVGSTRGWRNQFGDLSNAGLEGNVTLTVLDVSDPANPQILGPTVVTEGVFARGEQSRKLDLLSLGNGLYAISSTVRDGKPVLLLVDPSDPNNPIVSASESPEFVNGMAVVGNRLYTTGASALSIYEIGDLESLPFTATVQIPKGTGVNVVPGSFNVPPDRIETGAEFDTLVWSRNLAFGNAGFTFTWNSLVEGIQPGEARDVTLGAEVTFTAADPGDPVQVDLSGWTAVQIDDNFQGNANWVLSDGNTKVNQIVNADPSIYVSDFDMTNDRIEGTWRVNTFNDDDFMGFVFGYQDAQHFYLFDWKQTDQDHRGFSDAGMSVKVVSADTPLNGFDLWPTAGNGQRVRTIFHNTIPYNDFTDYQFALDFRPGEFTITVKQGDTVLESVTLQDDTYTSGKFGFYNYSQDQVVYSGFARTPLAATGTIDLPPTTVASEQILGLDPAARTVRPGETTTYDVLVTNPTDLTAFYNVLVAGVPASWVDIESFIEVPPQSTIRVPLELTSDSFAALADYGFTVILRSFQVQSAVEGLLTLTGQPVETPVAQSHGVVVEIDPAQASVGQGMTASYVVRVTNAGSATDRYALTANLPNGFTAEFAQDEVDVPAGAVNFRDVRLTIAAPRGVNPGEFPFTVTATLVGEEVADEVSDTDNAFVALLESGVDVELNPPAGAPGGTFQMTVTNIGRITDSFDLSVAAPASLAASLMVASVTLAPGESRTIPIQVGEIDFAFPGALQLAGVAVSQTFAAVRDADVANVNVAGEWGMTARFDPDTRTLPAPGETSFLLLVENVGNLDDEYTATIVATTGPVTANLIGELGEPTQTIGAFFLPGLSTGAILLEADLTAALPATITVRITSLTDPTITTDVTATIGIGQAAQGRIGGFVYVDVNNNGVKDPPELGLPNVPVTIAGPVAQTVLTGLNGEYRFEQLPLGVYTISQTQPSAFNDGKETPGQPLSGTVENDRFVGVTLDAANVLLANYNFGERGLRAGMITKRLLLASTPPPEQLMMDLMAPDGTGVMQFRAARDATLTAIASDPNAAVELYTAGFLPVALNGAGGTLRADVAEGEDYLLVVGGGAGNVGVRLNVQPQEIDAGPFGHFTNRKGRTDVDGNGAVRLSDVVGLVSHLRTFGSHRVATPAAAGVPAPYYDVSGDNFIGVLDLVLVVDALRRQSSLTASAIVLTGGEGEPGAAPLWAGIGFEAPAAASSVERDSPAFSPAAVDSALLQLALERRGEGESPISDVSAATAPSADDGDDEIDSLLPELAADVAAHLGRA